VKVVLAGVAALVLAGAAAATPGIGFFRTPTGNIGCVYAAPGAGLPAAYLRCDIRSGLRPRPARPKGCDLDWGDSVELRRTGRTLVTCHGDTALDPHAPVLTYGKSFVRPGFKCVSKATGLTCTNAAGHGFFLSRERWSSF
jgi:hypothetical protein